MRTQWITDLSKLLIEHPFGVDEDEILLVKCFAINRAVSLGVEKFESDVKIYSADFEIIDAHIRWHIHDTIDDNLIIDTPVKKGKGLGYTDYSQIDNDFDTMYIITAYRIVHKGNLKHRFAVSICENTTKSVIQTIPAETLTEAKAITAALNANGINTKIDKI